MYPTDTDPTYQEIEQLVLDTFHLWDQTRQGFSWRKYYMNHTQRVLTLSCQMGADIGADTKQLAYAAILHDITKRFDGSIKRDDGGSAILDEEGFWLNETVSPARVNWITAAYDKMDLHGQIHHVSGATMTELVLREFGFEKSFVQPVAKIVRGHLKGKVPAEVFEERYREPEVRLLYDADTIDPNVGYSAFYRNIQINAGRAHEKGEEIDLREYIQKLPKWVNSKDQFFEHMLTDRAREVCAARQQRNRETMEALNDELAEFELNRKYGLLGVVEFLLTNAEDPSLHEHATELADTWLPERERMLADEAEFDADLAGEALGRARKFQHTLRQEIEGQL